MPEVEPPSKGRIEAVVKFFKYNFARYRQYSEQWVWNEEFENWLHRTGNAKKHSITKRIPAEVFAIERGYLTPVSYEMKNTDNNILLRKIRKDNTVMYEGNRYTVPTGTFGVHKEVQLETQGDELLIYAGFCDVLLARHKLCFKKGPTGLGKTRLSVGLGLKAVEAGYNVAFVSLDELMRLLKISEISTRAARRVRTIRNSDLVILDEVGFMPISRQDANKLYEFVNSLYFKKSIILTSNKSFEEWSEFLGDSIITAAIFDRLAHQCEIFSLDGPSYRMENRRTIFGN